MSQAPSGWSQVRRYLLLSLVCLGTYSSFTECDLQAIVLKLLQSWGIEGYLEWLQNLRHSYAVRRDWMVRSHYTSSRYFSILDGVLSFYFRIIADHVLQCDALNEYFDLNTPSGSIETYAYLKSVSSAITTERKPIFSFTPPAVRSLGFI